MRPKRPGQKTINLSQPFLLNKKKTGEEKSKPLRRDASGLRGRITFPKGLPFAAPFGAW